MRRLLVALAGGALLLGCGRSRPNVLLVTFDTTRWDHVGYATGKKDLTPTLDALAGEGTWFSTCVTCQPNTLPAHTSIMTGLEPYHHGVRNNGTYVVPQRVTTLAESLQAKGWETHAIVSAFVLDSQFGLDQGFAGYDDDLSAGAKQKMFMFKEIKAAQTAGKAIDWLKQRPQDKPFFLWIHFFDPHADYEPPPDVAAKFVADPYSGEIYYADRELGRVITTLADEAVLDRTLVVFTADHGDGLGEHGENTHGIFIYESTTRVPLLLRGPGVPRGTRVDDVVRSIDIAPTILDLVGVPAPADVDGRDLREVWRGGAPARRAYVETMTPRLNFGWAELRGLRDARAKVIDAPRPEAYDLAADPGETHDLAATPDRLPESAPAMREAVKEITAADPFTHGEQQEVAIDAETREKLRALGYVSGAPATAGDKPRPDPKDRIAYWEAFQQAQSMIRAEQLEPALAAIRQLLSVDPDNVVALGSLANVLVRTGQKAEALAAFRRMMELDPKRETAYLGAAKLLAEAGDYAGAEGLARAVISMQPNNPEGFTEMGDLFLERERYPEAEEWFRKALKVDPNSSTAASGLGNCLNRAGRLEEARTLLAAAYRHDSNSHALAYNLAVVSERLGDHKAAVQLYQAALRLEPDHSMTWNNLGSLLDRAGKRQDAIKLIAKAHELDKDNVEATYNLGVLLLLSGKPAQALPLLDDAAARRPDLVQAAIFRARALEGVGKLAEALAAWHKLAVRDAPAYLQIARLELAAGRTEAARQALAEGIRRGGPPVREAAAKIPKLAPLLTAGPGK